MNTFRSVQYSVPGRRCWS